MITLDQVLLLEQKVESAVAKIQQLEAENDALRSKCTELTNALSAKSEQLSSFETDQNKIELGIRKALDRLNSIENSVLKAAGQIQTPAPAAAEPKVAPAAVTPTPQEPVKPAPAEPQVIPQATQQAAPQVEPKVTSQSFETMKPVAAPEQADVTDETEEVASEAPADEDFDSEYPGDYAEDNSQDNLGFDIF